MGEIRALPQRRFDPDDKSWTVPAQFAAEVLEALSSWDFTISPPVRALAARGGRNAQVRRLHRAARRDSLTPYQLNARAREVLREAFDEEVWLVGEVSGWRPRRGTAFFELIERGLGGDPKPRARVRAVAFGEDLVRLEETLGRMRPPLEMRDGLEVRVQGRVELYEGSGLVQVRIRELDPFHTISALTQQREKVLEALDDMGVSELNLSLEEPDVPLRVGLITSVGSDAYNDIINELKMSRMGFQVLVFDARMQGSRLERTVLQALRFFERNARRVDVVVIARGGGARTELSQFDTFAIGKAVCELPVPLMVGIGHHLDHSLLDDLARSFKTPTAVAQALVSRVQAFQQALVFLEEGIMGPAQRRLEGCRVAFDALAAQVAREASQRLRERGSALSAMAQDLGRWSSARLREQGRQLEELAVRVPHGAHRRLSQAERELDLVEARLSPRRLSRDLGRQQQQLEELSRRLSRATRRRVRQARGGVGEVRLKPVLARVSRQRRELDELQERLRLAVERLLRRQARDLAMLSAQREALDPARVLERGYALLTDGEGRSIRHAEQVAQGQRVRARLGRGDMTLSRVDAPNETDDENG